MFPSEDDREFMRVIWQAGDPDKRMMLQTMGSVLAVLLIALLAIWTLPWPEWFIG